MKINIQFDKVVIKIKPFVYKPKSKIKVINKTLWNFKS